MNRPLRSDEIVHHLDCNKANNREENLLLMDRASHRKIHAWISKGAPICESYRMNRVNSGKSKATKVEYCQNCGVT